MRHLPAILSFALLLSSAACTQSDQEKTKAEANEAGRKIKEGAKDLDRRAEAALQPDIKSAGDKLDHAAMLAKVKTKLATDAGASTLTNVTVDISGSVVTLSGTVASDSQKKAAELSASQVDGVTKVQNNLTVQP